MNRNKVLGLVILLAVIAGVIFFQTRNNQSIVTVTGFVGGEKVAFLENRVYIQFTISFLLLGYYY